MDQTAQVLHVALAGRGQHGTRAEEQEALEQRVIEDVEQRGGERQRRREVHAIGPEGERQAEADEDDPDVLDRVVGEQPLQIVLHQRIEHAEHRGAGAERQNHQAPPPGGQAQKVEDDAHEAVDGDLGHHPAHQGRDVAGRRRMGERQPDVQRHEAGLGAGAEQRQGQDQGREARRQAGAPDRLEGIAAARSGEQAESEQKRERAEARHDEVDVAGLRVALLVMVRHHQRPGRERHELPGEQEGEGVVGQRRTRFIAGEERREERQDPGRRRFVPAVAQAVGAGRGTTEVDHHEEECGERVEPEMGADPGQAERQDDRRGITSRDETGQGHHQPERGQGEARSVDPGRCVAAEHDGAGARGQEQSAQDQDQREPHAAPHDADRTGRIVMPSTGPRGRRPG